MRVALTHLRHARSGGTERYLDQLAAALAERGDEVSIVCRTHEEPPHPAVRFAQLRGAALGRGMRLLRFARAVEAHVADADYDVVYGLGRTWSQDAIRLGGGTWALYLERSMAADRPRWQRMLGRDALTDRICLAIERRTLSPGGTPLVVCNSHMIADEIQQRYATEPERIRVIHNTVDCERFSPELRAGPGRQQRRAWGFHDDDIVALFLGNNYRRKGLDRVLRALAETLHRRSRARLAVVGQDRDIAGWRRRAASLGLSKACVFAGPSRDTERCYAAADCYVLPTRYDPFANTTLEALASGLPVITTTGNGGSEVLDAHCGSVVSWREDDHGALAEALHRWLDPAAVAAGGRAARSVALEHRLELTITQSLALVDEAATRRSAG